MKTTITLTDKVPPFFGEGAESRTYDGVLSRAEAIRRVAEEITAESIRSHNEHYRADVENGPCADDVPDFCAPEDVEAMFTVTLEYGE